jgi:hypothetical protein
MLLLAQSLWIVGKDMVSKWKVGRLALNMGGWKLALKCRKLEGGALVPITTKNHIIFYGTFLTNF